MKIKYALIHWIFLLCYSCLLKAQNEVVVTPMISPPYSPYLYDYEDELILTIVNQTGRALEIKLSGYLENDRGMRVFTKPDFQPTSPIELEPFGATTIFANMENQGFLDRQNVEIIAPEDIQQSVLRTGILPEGNYQLCLQALDFDSGAPLSSPAPQGCLFFPISRLQPPVLINPACASTLMDEWPIFNWTPPIGDAGTTNFTYDLYLLKLYPEQNENDAMNRAVEYRAGNPIIFENLPLPSYTYQPSDPPLEAGATYAVQVIARDPENRLSFVNGGRSEVCTIQMPGGDTDAPSNGNGINTGGNMTFSSPITGATNLPTATVSGKLLYQFPYTTRSSSQEESGPQFESASVAGLTMAAQAEEIIQQSSQYSSSQQAALVDDNLAQQIADYEPDYSQPIWFGPEVVPNKPLALPNTRVNLVLRYLWVNAEILGDIYSYVVVPPGAMNDSQMFSDEEGYAYDNGQILASGYTDDSGNYSLSFVHYDSLHTNVISELILGNETIEIEGFGLAPGGTPGHGYFMRVLRLEVDNPYFASPDLNLIIQPNQGVVLPDQIALVKAYNLKVNIRSDESEGQIHGKNAPLPGIVVDIRRNPSSNHLQHFLPENEGQNLDETILDSGGYHPLVSRKETKSDGSATFTHLVQHVPTTLIDRYKCKAYSKLTETFLAYVPRYFKYPDEYEFPYINFPPPDAPYPFVTKNQAGVYLPLYNSQVTVETYETTAIMYPDEPMVVGRVRDGTAPIANALVSLWQNDQIVTWMLTGEDGYFIFQDLEPGTGFHIKVVRNGYHTLYHPLLNGQENTFSLTMGEKEYFGELQLQPKGQVKGYLVNEDGQPVMADVKIGTGPWKESQWMTPPNTIPSLGGQSSGNSNVLSVVPVFTGQLAAGFISSAQSGQNIPIIIDPHSDQYFRDTFYVDVLDQEATQDLGIFTLKERLHRVRFSITDQNGFSVRGAKISLQDSTKLSNRVGQATFTFANAGQHFLVRVDPPPGQELAPFQDYVHIPVTKNWHEVTIELRPGFTITGIVTAGPDSLPLADARVFIEDNTTLGQGLPLLETYTLADGSYSLSGIPTDTVLVHGMMSGTPISFRIHAVKSDPSIAYIGASNTIAVNDNAPLHLHLQTVDGVDGSKLLGFPVEIESYTPSANGQAVISGAFVEPPDNPNFSLRMANYRMTFSDIPVEIGSVTNSAGLPYWEPLISRVPIDADEIPLKIFSGFQGEVRSSHVNVGQSGGVQQLSFHGVAIERTAPAEGALRGAVFLELESFKFTYQYSGDFYLSPDAENLRLDIFRSEAGSYPERSFNIGDLNPLSNQFSSLQFSIHEFPAHADKMQSSIQGDTVRLYTVLHTNIAKTNPPDLAIEAGEIKITPSTILPFSQGEALNFQLEEWEVVSQTGWFYDQINGGLHIQQAVIKTGLVDVPVNGLVIRYDDLNDPQLELHNPAQPFLLAGVAPLTLASSNATLHYDPSTITDQQPHWIIEILGSASQPAASAQLPHVDVPVQFNNFKLISDGTMDVNIPVQNLRVYDIIDVVTTGISAGSDFFAIQGSGDLHIPGTSSDLSTILTFTKSGGQIALSINPLTFEVAGAGKVFFYTHTGQNDQQFQTGQYTAYGHFEVKDEADNSFTLEGLLTKTKTSCIVDIIQVNTQNQRIVCGGAGSNALEVYDGQMIANLPADSWNFMEFDARPISSKGLASDSPMMHFTVEGDINANDEEIEIEGIDLGFAQMELTFNISDMTLSGHLLVGGQGSPPIDIGVAAIHQGQINFLMSDQGFYFLFGGSVEVPVVGGIDACFLVGHYDQFDEDMYQVFTEYAYQNSLPSSFQNGFSGFLVNGNWEPVNEHLDESFLNFSVEIYAHFGVEIRVAADFADGYFLFSGLGHGSAGINISFDLLICDFGMGAHVALELLAATEIQNSNVTFTGCVSLALGLIFEACGVTYCWENSVRLQFVMNNNSGISFDAALGETCSGNDDPLGLEQGSGADDNCN